MRSADAGYWVFRALRASPLRTLLTALGIGIGIFSVTILTSIGEGIRQYLMESFSQFGTRIVAVTPGRATTHGIGGLLSTVRPLSLEDARALMGLAHVEAVVPMVQGAARIEAGRYARDTSVYGVGPDMARAWRFEVASGRFLPGPDLQNSRQLAVLGSRVRSELFRSENPLGEYVRIGGQRFRVIGTMARKGQLLGFDLDDAVYIPADLSLALFNRPGLMEVDVVFRASTTSEAMSRRIRERLMALHGEEDFTLFTQEDMLASLDRVLAIMKFAIGAIGGVALLVGSVGVLGIMNAALSERIEEIGLLRALGTTRSQVLGLFLAEAVVLSLAGGLAGVAGVGVIVAVLGVLMPGLPVALEPAYALASIGLSIGIGLVAGIAPALNAAAQDPIEALRSG